MTSLVSAFCPFLHIQTLSQLYVGAQSDSAELRRLWITNNTPVRFSPHGKTADLQNKVQNNEKLPIMSRGSNFQLNSMENQPKSSRWDWCGTDAHMTTDFFSTTWTGLRWLTHQLTPAYKLAGLSLGERFYYNCFVFGACHAAAVCCQVSRLLPFLIVFPVGINYPQPESHILQKAVALHVQTMWGFSPWWVQYSLPMSLCANTDWFPLHSVTFFHSMFTM